MTKTPPPARRPEEPAVVPVFGTWRAIHAAVALSALLVMALLALFSRWPF
jgi:anti-sigma-K factor RskA